MPTVVDPPVTVTVATAVAVRVWVEVAVIVTLVAAPGAVNVVMAPLAVCAGLNVPHDAAGAQVQSTPAFVESLFTVAEIVAVPFAAKVEGGACVNAIVEFPDGGVDEDDPVTPQPEIFNVKNTSSNPANSSDTLGTQTFVTTPSSFV
jgi:hypothetical protein